MTTQQTLENEAEWSIKGQIDLDTDASVLANRGSNQTVEKTATGEYTVTIKGTANLKLVEMLNERCNFSRATPATAKGCRVDDVSQDTSTDDVTIVLKTTANAEGSGADTDTTGAITLNYEVVIRTAKMGNPL